MTILWIIGIIVSYLLSVILNIYLIGVVDRIDKDFESGWKQVAWFSIFSIAFTALLIVIVLILKILPRTIDLYLRIKPNKSFLKSVYDFGYYGFRGKNEK